MTAADRWSTALAGWAIPDAILAGAPESPWGFPPPLFAATDGPTGALHRLARSGLGDAMTVLDVGCGGGAASIPLVPPARVLTGVDRSAAMLASFAAAAEAAGAAHTELLGDWPAAAAAAPVTDVVVCRNVVYNVADIADFVDALSRHATNRVVVELTRRHPSVALAPLWRHFWGLPRPDGPGADLFVEVVTERGHAVVVETERRPVTKAVTGAEHTAFVRRRLCLPASRDPEVAALLAGEATTEAVVVAWDGRPAPAI